MSIVAGTVNYSLIAEVEQFLYAEADLLDT